jgi:hypothetical protein
MITRRRIENLPRLGSDTGWSDVAGLLAKVNICMDSINVLCTEGPPHRMQGGMRDMGYSALNWSFGVHEDPSDDLVHEDSGAESESNGAGRRNNNSNDDDESAEDRVVSVTVGLPRRFGHPACDPEPPSQEEPNPAPDLATESSVKTSLREILRKVTVNETVLRSAIESLGGGVKGLQAVVDYVKHFQESNEPDAGNVNPDDFTRGLEQFCSVHRAQNHPAGAEMHQGSGAGTNRPALPNLQIRGQDEWARNGHAGDPFTMGYMENMSGFFPNFCYPYPPPFASYGPFNMGVPPIYMPMMQVPHFTPSLEYVHKTDAVTKASRKSRIARRRGHATTDSHQARPPTKPAVHVAGVTVQAGNQETIARQKAAVTSSGQVCVCVWLC